MCIAFTDRSASFRVHNPDDKIATAYLCRSLGRSQTAEPVGTPGGDDTAGLARFVRWPSSPASPTQPALPPWSWRGTPAQHAEERYMCSALGRRWGAGGRQRTSAIAQRSVELPTRSPISFFIVARGNLDRLNCSKRASCSSVATLTNCSYSSLRGTGMHSQGDVWWVAQCGHSGRCAPHPVLRGALCQPFLHLVVLSILSTTLLLLILVRVVHIVLLVLVWRLALRHHG